MLDTTIAHVNYRWVSVANQHIQSDANDIHKYTIAHLLWIFRNVLPRNKIMSVIFQSLLAIIQEQIIYMEMLDVS